MRAHDINTLAVWLSPEFLTPLARMYGLELARNLLPHLLEEALDNPDMLAVLGAEQAYKDIRGMVRSYLSYVRKRDKVTSDLELAQALRTMGYAGNFQRVMPMDLTDWRKSAAKIWKLPASTPGCVRLDLDELPSERFMLAFLVKAVSRMMRTFPELNRAFLQGRVWLRETSHVMVTTRLGADKVGSFVLDGRGSLKELNAKLFAATKKALKTEKHELSFLASSLMDRWAESGVITSSACAMVSNVGSLGVPEGMSALAQFNGIPLTFTAGEWDKGVVPVWVNADHRVFDGDHMGRIYSHLKEEARQIDHREVGK